MIYLIKNNPESRNCLFHIGLFVLFDLFHIIWLFRISIYMGDIYFKNFFIFNMIAEILSVFTIIKFFILLYFFFDIVYVAFTHPSKWG